MFSALINDGLKVIINIKYLWQTVGKHKCFFSFLKYGIENNRNIEVSYFIEVDEGRLDENIYNLRTNE